MTFRNMENSFDLPPENRLLESVHRNCFLYKRVLRPVLLQIMDWGCEWFDAGKVIRLTPSTSPS